MQLVENMPVLALDVAGNPHGWLGRKDAAGYYLRDQVSWEAGENVSDILGGFSRKSGDRTILRVNSIIALKDARYESSLRHLSRSMLFRRDKHICAYCSELFHETELEAEHVIPESKGGEWSWMNLVSACRTCNNRKGARTPEQAKMPLVYVPYVPNVFEHFILTGRHVLADQMDYLIAGVSKESRFLN